MIVLYILLGLALLFHLWRQSFLHRALPPISVVPFEGRIFRVGETAIAVRKLSGTPSKTVICFPGFTETPRYFTDLYAETDYELILISNAAYHMPFDLCDAELLQWDTNPYAVGTVEYDAFYLAHAVKELATCDTVVIHGHSRGGAVTLEAGYQFPEIMKTESHQVTALLECAAVPEGTAVAASDNMFVHAVTRYFIPLFFAYARRLSPEKLNTLPMMQPTTPLKTALVAENFRTPVAYHVFMTNMENLLEWQRSRPIDLYDNFPSIKVVMGQRDDVLDNHTMKVSAEAGRTRNPGVEIIETQNTNHFVGVETPELIRQLVAKA